MFNGFKMKFKQCNILTIIPANIYLFKVNSRKIEKGVKYIQS